MGAVILIPTYMWSMGWIGHIDAAMYRLIWWAFGHSSQQINVAAHVSVWYAIAAIVFGAKPLSEKVSRTAFVLYIAFLQLASAHHLLVDPGLEFHLEDIQYLIRHVSCGAGQHDPRTDRSRVLLKSHNAPRVIPRACSNGCEKRPGVIRCSRVCSSRLIGFRLPRWNFRCGHGNRADQHHHPQHHLCTRAISMPRS